jgi:hypothetical protein
MNLKELEKHGSKAGVVMQTIKVCCRAMLLLHRCSRVLCTSMHYVTLMFGA